MLCRGSQPAASRGKPGVTLNARRILAAFALLVWPPAGKPALFHRPDASAPRGPAITLRKRLHVNTLITAPATMEIEWANDYSITSGDYSMPSLIKYTP